MTSISTRVLRGLALLGVATSVACSDFLNVEDPGRYTDEALNSPAALNAVANGVEADMQGQYDDFASFHGLLSDELMHTGTWVQWDDMDTGKLGPAIGTDNGVHSSLIQRITAAKKAQERFATVLADSANRSVVMARMIATEGWVNLLMGMHACESPKEAGGAVVPDTEMYDIAISVLTNAITVAKAANSVEYERFATAGRARANLFANKLDAALADAKTIPDTYVYNAKFSDTGTNNNLSAFTYRTRLKAGGLDQRRWATIDTIAGFMRDPATGELDKRVAVTRAGNGADNVKKFYAQEKFKNLSDDIAMTSGWEMRLIEAEVYMKKNDFTNALAMINKVRANAGLAPVTGTTQAQIQTHLLNERFAQLFLEGHRATDIARFGLTATVLGTGRAIKFALTTDEINLNPTIAGKATGRCPAKS
jgi:hypothetical protein